MNEIRTRRAFLSSALLAAGGYAARVATAQTAARQPRITARELGLLINESDALSVEVGEYYRTRRQVPEANVVRIRFPVRAALSANEFASVKALVDAKLPQSVQALALAWTMPYRVACMSITSAFAYGFSKDRCAEGCRTTPAIRYFDSDSRRPFTDFAMRPAMLLAARDFSRARELIDRGVASDATSPTGTAYLMDTSDKNRNSRRPAFTDALGLRRKGLDVRIIKADVLQNRQDILFYFTGLEWVEDISSNRFLPGAMADHLTSTGGVLPASRQMSALQWLEAGATGSYGTVVEPCNFPSKFPSAPVAMRHYLSGDTLVEAYWKSVLMPSQGLFIGEPLAAPFAPRAP